MTPRKVEVGLKRSRELNKRRFGWRLAWCGTEKKEASHLLGLRGRHQYSEQRSNWICSLHCCRDRWRGGPNGQIVSVKTAADGRRQKRRKIIDEKTEKYRAKNGSLRNISTDLNGAVFVILKNTQARLSERKDRVRRPKQGQPKWVCEKGRGARQSWKLSRNQQQWESSENQVRVC